MKLVEIGGGGGEEEEEEEEEEEGEEGERCEQYLLMSWLKMGAHPNPSTGWDSSGLPVPKETTASIGTLG